MRLNSRRRLAVLGGTLGPCLVGKVSTPSIFTMKSLATLFENMARFSRRNLNRVRRQWLAESETIVDKERSLLFCAAPNTGSLQFRMLAKRMQVRLAQR